MGAVRVRRGARTFSVVLGVALLTAVLAACRVSLAGSSELVVASDRSTAVELTCSDGGAPCTGSVAARIAGSVGDAVPFELPAGGSGWVALSLTEAQYSTLPTSGGVTGEVLVDDTPIGEGDPKVLAVTFERAPVPTTGLEVETSPVPAGAERFLDSLGRDLLGREMTAPQRQGLVATVATDRAGLVAFFASSDAWVGQMVDDGYSRVLDRAPSTAERAAAIQQVRGSGSARGLWASLLAGDEFFESSGSTNSGWANTAAQRLWFRDPFAVERDAIVGYLDGGMTRAQAADALVGSDEAVRVRAQRWSQKMLSRDPSAQELPAWAATISSNGDLALIAELGASSAYDTLAQARVRSASMTTAAGTVVVGMDRVHHVEWNDQGTGEITLDPSITPPEVGGHLVIDDPAGTAGGIGRVLAVAPAGGGSRVTIAVASLTDVFVAAEVTDTTEPTDIAVLPVERAHAGSRAASGDAACTAALNSSVEAQIGIDVRNDSHIQWHWSAFKPVLDKVRVAAVITPSASLKVNGLSLDAACRKEFLNRKINAPIQAGPVTIPGFFEIKAGLGAEMHWQALTMSASVSVPCTIGFEVTGSSQVSNISGCRPLQSNVTLKPLIAGTANAHAYGSVGYHLGADLAGWAKARIGLDAEIELGVDLTAATDRTPNWTLHGYLDASLDLSGGLGPWSFNRNLASASLLRDLLGSNQIGAGTQDGGSIHPTNDTVHPNPPAPDRCASIANTVWQTSIWANGSTIEGPLLSFDSAGSLPADGFPFLGGPIGSPRVSCSHISFQTLALLVQFEANLDADAGTLSGTWYLDEWSSGTWSGTRVA